VICGELHIAHDGSSNEAVFHGHHVRVSRLIEHLDSIQTNVQELVNRLERASDRKVVFKLNSDSLVC